MKLFWLKDPCKGCVRLEKINCAAKPFGICEEKDIHISIKLYRGDMVITWIIRIILLIVFINLIWSST